MEGTQRQWSVHSHHEKCGQRGVNTTLADEASNVIHQTGKGLTRCNYRSVLVTASAYHSQCCSGATQHLRTAIAQTSDLFRSKMPPRTRSSAPAAASAVPSTAQHLASLCGFPADAIPPSVVLAAEGLEITDELERQLRESPGRNIDIGEVIEHDCRSKETRARASNRRRGDPVKIIQWNIERGYKLKEIIALLEKEDADIIALQEIDIGCARSGWKDTGLEIAQALGMNYVFVCEFNELYSPLRPALTQGGGVHGNGILSRFSHCHTDTVSHAASFDWPNRGHEKKEPRTGSRFSVATEVQLPEGPLLVYSAHFEVFAGIHARVASWKEIVADAESRRHRTKPSPTPEHQIVLGDFNTLAHGIARLSSAYSQDPLRWGSLGWTEAEWWVGRVLLSPDTNPSGFFDPFDAYADVTLWNYSGWFQGKLDWMLMRGLTPQGKLVVGNHDYAASDHKLLGCTVTLDDDVRTKSSAALRKLMPLRRWRPGIITSSSREPHIYLPQILVFFLALALIVWTGSKLF